jgi:hypothetical protein
MRKLAAFLLFVSCSAWSQSIDPSQIQGAVSTSAQLQSAITACGSSPCAINVYVPVAVTSNTTIPANVALKVAYSGQLQPANSVTLIINGTVDAAPVQIFGGSGTVTGLSLVRPEWLGTTVINAAVVGALSSSGGTIALQNAVYTSIYYGTCFTKDDVWIRGAKMPVTNGAYTALVNGTIIRGGFSSCGSNRLKVTDIGFDNGSALGTSTTDAFAASGLTGSGADPIIDSPYLENVTAMLSGSLVAFHAIRLEHCNNAYVRNAFVYFGVHGMALKCTNSNVDTLHAYGNHTDGLIVKADPYTATAHVKTRHIISDALNSGSALNFGVVLDSNSGNLTDVTVSDVTVIDAWGSLNISGEGTGHGNGLTVDGLTAINTATTYGITYMGCIQVTGNSASNVNVSNTQCLNNTGTNIGMQPLNIAGSCTSCRFFNMLVSGSNSASYITGVTVFIDNYTSLSPTFGVVFQLVGATTVLYLSNAYTTETLLNSGASTAGSLLYSSNVSGTSSLAGVIGLSTPQTAPSYISSSGVFSGGQTTTVSSLSTATTLAGSGAYSGLLHLRDNTSGGSALLLVDPNAGAQLLGTSQITGLAGAGVTFSSGVWHISLTSGSVPRSIGWTFYQ